MKHQFSRVICVCVCLLTPSGTLLAQSTPQTAQPANQEEEKNDPTKGSKDVDQTVAYPMAQVLEAAKQAITVYGCDVKKEKPDYLECTRDRRFGLLMNAGGEKVTVRLTASGAETRVQVKTGKGFYGRLAKKNWSTPIFEDMLKTLKGA